MVVTHVVDIHCFADQYTKAVAYVSASALSARNKDLLLRYRDACLLRQVCGQVRLIRSFYALTQCGLLGGVDFDRMTRADVERVLSRLVARGLSPATMCTYKAILKRFLTWVAYPDEFPNVPASPATVSWMRTHLRRKDERRLQRTELLTPEDIEKLLGVARNPRDRALIAILWESGGRVSEIGNLQVKHVAKQAHGFSVDVNGKTGQRSPLLVSSSPYLAMWLAIHPRKDDPESPLWVHLSTPGSGEPLLYRSISALLQRYFARAHIAKPFHPHIFRHSRVTYVLANGIMNEAQSKAYFGWTPGSEMLATYSHLVDQDANNAILRENHLTPAQQRARDLLPVSCRICNELNPAKAEYCTKCGAVLDLKKAYEHQTLHDLKEELVLKMFKLLVDRGLVDEAAHQIHDANLGLTLKRLARHISGEEPLTPMVPASPSQAPVPTS